MMMRKVFAVIAALMMVAVVVPIAFADTSDSVSSDVRTATYVPGADYYRPAIAYKQSAVPEEAFYARASEIEAKDREFAQCLEEDRLEDFVCTWSADEFYYIYRQGERSPSECAASFHREGERTIIPANSGTCRMEIVSIEQTHGYNVKLVRATSAASTTDMWNGIKAGDVREFTFDSFITMWFQCSEEIKVTYRLSGSSAPKEYVPTEGATINSVYSWYKCVLPSGTYKLGSDQVAFYKGSDAERRFLIDVVDANRYYRIDDDDSNRYGALPRNEELKIGSAIDVYIMDTSVTPYSGENILEKDKYGFKGTSYTFERLTKMSTLLYAAEDTSFKVAVGGYDMSEKMVYLIYKEDDSWRFVFLAPNVLYTVENEGSSKAYYLASYSYNMGANDPLFSDITLYTEGLAKEADDTVTYILIGAMIGAGALAAISLMISHGRPRWAGARADKNMWKKNGKVAGIPAEQSADDMCQQERITPDGNIPSDKERPLNEAPPSENAGEKKEGRFGRFRDD